MKTVVIIIVIVALGGGGYAVYHNSHKSKSTSASSNVDHMNSSSSTKSSSTNTSSVTIANFAFSPTDITVKKGTKVTWTNNDGTTHIIAGDTSDGPSNGTVAPGQSYSFTFDTVGTFKYHCAIHSSMTGSVTVTE